MTTMDYYEAVASQGQRLESSARSVGDALAEMDLAPWRNGLLVASSMGASSHASVVFVDRLVRHGRRAVNIDASEMMGLAAGTDFADSYVFVSEGGRSRETIAAAQLAPRGRRLGLTNNPEAPFGDVVDAVIGLAHGEDSPVYTVGYTATLQAFGLLASAIDAADDGDDWPALPERVSETLSSLAEKAAAVATTFSRLASFDFVGTGASRAAAAEAALLFREATRTCTASFDTYQYLHGPMEPLTAQTGCMIFGSRTRGDPRQLPRRQRDPYRACHLGRGLRSRWACGAADPGASGELTLDPRDRRGAARRRRARTYPRPRDRRLPLSPRRHQDRQAVSKPDDASPPTGSYRASPRPTFDEPTRISRGTATRHIWGDPQSGEVADWIYVSSRYIHALVFELEPHGAFRHSRDHRTIFAADELLYVLEGVMAIANPETGEVCRVPAGESVFFRRDTWHHAFAHGEGPLRVLELFSPPPSTGSSGAYAERGPISNAPAMHRTNFWAISCRREQWRAAFTG